MFMVSLCMQNDRGGATCPNYSVTLAGWEWGEACHIFNLTASLYSNSDLQIRRGDPDEKTHVYLVLGISFYY